MSFIVTVEAQTRTVFPQFGIYMDTGLSDIEIVYTLKSVSINADNSAMAIFSVAVNEGSQDGEIQFSFTYSGSGDPREEAEVSLRDELSVNESKPN